MWLEDFRSIVTQSRIVELSHVLTMDMPHSPNHPPFMFRLTKLHGDAKDSDKFTVSSDMFNMGSHNGTHIDGLGHVGCCGMVYGGVHGDSVSTRRGGFEGIGMAAKACLLLMKSPSMNCRKPLGTAMLKSIPAMPC
jgi:hypothetical protein